tara:strand:- start:41 stop:457 length:417 start_codon:yes stop_codon:yes gene_type:complete
MKIDWDKLKIIESRDIKKHGVSDYKQTIKELRTELKRRGLKYSGSKEELLDRLKEDNNRIEVAEADGQIKTLEQLKARVKMFQDYEDAAMIEWTAAKERWDAAVDRKYKVLEEKDLAIKAYEGFKEVLRMQGFDVDSF